MLKKSKSSLLLLVLVLSLVLPQSLFANPLPYTKKVYHVPFTTEDVSTPTAWYNSTLFSNSAYRQDQFVRYWQQTPIVNDGTKDTAFYVAYNEEGVSIFLQADETERDADNTLKDTVIETFIQTGSAHIAYHQLIVHTDGSPHEWYEWQTENRNNRPLKNNITVITEEIPTGWGIVIFIPWSAYYDYVPLDGEPWEFSMIRWGGQLLTNPNGSKVELNPTWGGNVHQPGRFNLFDFEDPTPAQRTAIQKNLIEKSWTSFGSTAEEVTAYWMVNGDTTDQQFYNEYVLPLIANGQTAGNEIPNLDSLSSSEIEALYEHVISLSELRYDVEEAREAFLKNWIRGTGLPNQAPTAEDGSYETFKNQAVSGSVTASDPDGDELSHALGTAPAQGTVVVNEDGSWTYTPNQDYTGADQFTVVVTDPSGETAVSTINVNVKVPPVIGVVLDKTVLSTPNHKMVPIEATITHSAGSEAIASFELVSITSNEADNGTGDGNTNDDIQGAEYGTADTSFSLRAERTGNSNGRIYTITYTVTDHEGYTATVNATVTVPKEKLAEESKS